MSGLQEAFYIIGIVFMGIMFVLVVALVVAVFVIRSKINHIQRTIESRISTVTHLAEKGGELAGLAASRVAARAKRATRKAKR
jgi:predicted Holliday junction resolvase-like endonuclease